MLLINFLLDDDKFSAHSGLLGRSIKHSDVTVKAFQSDAGAIAQNLIGQNGQDCTIATDCTDQDNPQASGCGRGQKKVGWERGKCGVRVLVKSCIDEG